MNWKVQIKVKSDKEKLIIKESSETQKLMFRLSKSQNKWNWIEMSPLVQITINHCTTISGKKSIKFKITKDLFRLIRFKARVKLLAK